MVGRCGAIKAMSLKVITWAWTVRLPPAPKLVLMALADEADDRGFCFPSHRHLANKCSISERSVRRMIALLAADHHLSIEHRFKKDRARTSNGYRLGLGLDPGPPWTICPGGSGQHWPGGADSVDQGGGQRWPGAPDTGVLVTTTEPFIEPTPPPQAAGEENEAQGRGGGDLCFPKAVTRSQRQALRNHLAGLSNEDAQRTNAWQRVAARHGYGNHWAQPRLQRIRKATDSRKTFAHRWNECARDSIPSHRLMGA